MRHRHSGRKLNRTSAHRKAAFKNLAAALIRHERIRTTLPKAKELRPIVERLITLAKQDTLHARRTAISRLPRDADIAKLFGPLSERFARSPRGLHPDCPGRAPVRGCGGHGLHRVRRPDPESADRGHG